MASQFRPPQNKNRGGQKPPQNVYGLQKRYFCCFCV
nr:MAG TPA: DNA binding protein [Caudoviricetes sp.]